MKDEFVLTEEELCSIFGESAVPLIEVLRNIVYEKYREDYGSFLADVFMGFEDYEWKLSLKKKS
jgi:hypothetical protein